MLLAVPRVTLRSLVRLLLAKMEEACEAATTEGRTWGAQAAAVMRKVAVATAVWAKADLVALGSPTVDTLGFEAWQEKEARVAGWGQ